MSSDEDVNARYYGTTKPGRRDYWRFMAAPRVRMSTILSILSPVPPGDLVDLGCGDGRFLSVLADEYPTVRLAGIDLSRAQIEKNRKEAPSLAWHVADLDGAISLPADLLGRFDVVTALELIEHVSDPHRLLSHALALAKPGGRLILSTQSGPLRETEKQVGHRQHFSLREMTGLLTSAGWRPVRVWNSGWPFHDLSKWMANWSPDRSMRHFGEESYEWPQKFLCLILRGLFKFNSKSRGAQLFAVAEKP